MQEIKLNLADFETKEIILQRFPTTDLEVQQPLQNLFAEDVKSVSIEKNQDSKTKNRFEVAEDGPINHHDILQADNMDDIYPAND